MLHTGAQNDSVAFVCCAHTHTAERETRSLALNLAYIFLLLGCDLLKWMQAERDEAERRSKQTTEQKGSGDEQKKKKKKEFAQIAKLTGDSDGDVASGSGNESERALANLFVPPPSFLSSTTPVLYLSPSLSWLLLLLCGCCGSLRNSKLVVELCKNHTHTHTHAERQTHTHELRHSISLFPSSLSCRICWHWNSFFFRHCPPLLGLEVNLVALPPRAWPLISSFKRFSSCSLFLFVAWQPIENS